MSARPKYRYKKLPGGRFRDRATGRFTKASTARRSIAATKAAARRKAAPSSEQTQARYLAWLAGEQRKKRRGEIREALRQDKAAQEREREQGRALEEWKWRVVDAFDKLGIEAPSWWGGLTYVDLDKPRRFKITIVHKEYEPRERIWTEAEEGWFTPRQLGQRALEDARSLESKELASAAQGGPAEKKKKSPDKPRLHDVEEIDELADIDQLGEEISEADDVAAAAAEFEGGETVPF